MDLKFRKRDVKDAGTLEALVVEHADSLEPSLHVVEVHPVFGEAVIDLVGIDPDGSLVLVALGLIGDGAMILRALGAYAWCAAYPEAVRQRYPAARVDVRWPPRVLFLAEGMPESFIRKVKRLAIDTIDCTEVQYLEAGGRAGLYFDVVARIRRGAATDEPPSAPAPVPRSAAAPVRAAATSAPAAEPIAPEPVAESKPEPVRVVAPVIASAEAAAPAVVRIVPPAPAAPDVDASTVGSSPPAAAPPAKPQAKTAARSRSGARPRETAAWPPAPTLATDEDGGRDVKDRRK